MVLCVFFDSALQMMSVLFRETDFITQDIASQTDTDSPSVSCIHIVKEEVKP